MQLHDTLVHVKEITLAPGSGRSVSLSVLQSNGQPIDFTIGTWSAEMVITEFPGDHISEPVILNSGVGGWLSFADGKVVLTPIPEVTRGWKLIRYHYDLYLKGPNPTSITERIEHGPINMDW